MNLKTLLTFKDTMISQVWLPAIFGGLSWSVYFSYLINLHHKEYQVQAFEPTLIGYFLFIGLTPLVAFCLNFLRQRWLINLYTSIEKHLILIMLHLLLWLPGLIVLLYPTLFLWASQLDLSVLGWLSMPLTTIMVNIPPTGYLYLLWFGFSFIGLLLLGYLLFFIHYLFEQPVNEKPIVGQLFLFGLLFFFSLGLWTTFIYPVTGDEPHYLMISQSIWYDHDINLTNQMNLKMYQAFYPIDNLDFHHTGHGGAQMISKHFPLLALMTAPLYGLLGRFGVVLFIMASAALIALLLYALVKAWHFSEQQARVVWLVSLFTVPLGIYFDLIFTELPAISLFLLGLLSFFKSKPIWTWMILLVACILPWFYPKYIPLAIILGGLTIIRSWGNKKQLLIKALFAIVCATGYVIFYQYYNGVTIEGNPYGTFHSLFSWRGLGNGLGLLVDRDFGLFATLPLALVAFIGIKKIINKNKWGGYLIVLVFLIEYLLYLHFDDFTGSAAISSRHFLPATILLLPAIGLVLHQWFNLGGWRKLIALNLMLITMVIVWLAAAWPILRYLSPKIKLWQQLGWSPSIFPSIADGMSHHEMIWGVLILVGIILVIIALNKQGGSVKSNMEK